MSPDYRAEKLFARSEERHAAKLDRFFAALFLVEWLSRIALAWARPAHEDDLFTAIFIGAFVATMPTVLVVWKPGTRTTRHAIAVAQMLYGALLVHLTKGASGAGVHVVVSLAVLALYRDWTVVGTGAAIGVLQAFVLNDPKTALTAAMWIALITAVLGHATRRWRADRVQIAELEAANQRTRAELLATMSREIRQPMTAILGSAEVLLDASGVAAMDPRSYVKRIRRNGEQLMNVLDHMSDATKIVSMQKGSVVEPMAQVPSASSPSSPARRQLDCSVLLVEDDLDNQKILTDHLQRAGVSVAIAPNGQVALSEVSSASERGKPFDLVLMDMQMPVLDGYAATTELRRRGYGAPILAITARAMKGDRQRCLDAGCTEYLTKPITRERLLQAVTAHALGSAATIPPPAVTASDEQIFSMYEDAAEMHELLDSFVTRLRQNAAEAEAAYAAGNIGELERIAHRLRGAAGSFGFMPISEAAGVVEDTAREGGDTEDALAHLVLLCRRARTRTPVAAAA